MLKSIRNSLILTSLLYIVLGGVLIAFPENSLTVGCLLIGVVTLLYGVLRIVSYFREGGTYAQRFDLFIGGLLAVLGLFLLICPRFVASIIPVALGVYLVVDSISALKKALDMRALGFEQWWISFLFALILAALGVVMIVCPLMVLSVPVVFIGAAFLFDGLYTLINTVVADRVYKQ